MSTDDRHRIIGKAAEDYAAIRGELAALKHRAAQVREQFSDISQYLNEF